MPRHPEQLERLARRLAWAEIDPAWLRRLTELARAEDLAGEGLRVRPERTGDATSALMRPGRRGAAKLVARHDLTPAGLGLISVVLSVFGEGCNVRILNADGAAVKHGEVLAEIEGPIATLLTAERTLLNFVQRLSGIATHTRRYLDAMGPSSTRLLDTRKTTPGFRMLEKYAVGQGGGWNHRLGLFDRIMAKDNHLAAEGAAAGEALSEWVRRARKARPDLLIEVEVDHLDQIEPACNAGADVILLDNFSLNDLRKGIPLVRAQAWCEVSGGISLTSLPLLASLEPDFISCGALTHAAPWADIGLDWA